MFLVALYSSPYDHQIMKELMKSSLFWTQKSIFLFPGYVTNLT